MSSSNESTEEMALVPPDQSKMSKQVRDETACVTGVSITGGIVTMAGTNLLWPGALANSTAAGPLCCLQASSLTVLPLAVGTALTALGMWGVKKLCELSEANDAQASPTPSGGSLQ